ncbi:hydroquinone glucosyltransferase-like [Senna tora]|uniref:Glycosyltransferase n=1 Tax=Senna tora TaxID=362788 RepID=A0A835C9S3_9FABA|nr:hydroquinone glucosyltransferase-like [Senna tora]
MAKTTHIAIVPSPWFSNLASALEFCKTLVHLHPDFHVTFILPILESPPQAFKSSLQDLPSNINPILLPLILKHELPPGVPPVVQMKLTVSKSLPHIQEFLKKSFTSKGTPLTALITDPFAIDALDFAKELNAMSFVYIATCATALFAFLHIPKLDCETSSFGGEFRDITEAIKIPGCDQLQIHGIDLPEQYKIDQAQLINNFFNSPREGGFECVKWLEKHPEKSVLYVSFGGGGALSQDQTNESAFGLEQSGKRFLRVMRAPSNSANVGLSSTNEDPLRFLPEGFLERTKERGLVVPSWAPQVQILSHGSIGGFLSHCGWNSVIESVNLGVPLIAWPLFTEQRLNAVMLSNGLKVALWPKMNENGIVVNKEIGKVVMSLMEGKEGKEIYKRMRCLKDFVTNSWNNGGSSTMALDEGVRREVGNHAKILNKIILQMQKNSVGSKDRDDGLINSQGTSTSLNVQGLKNSFFSQETNSSETQPRSASMLVESDGKRRETNEELSKSAATGLIPLKESIGHTEVEVIAGALLGFLVGLAVYNFM